MTNYEVDVNYLDRVFDTIPVEADDKDEAEFQALNIVRDGNPEASNVEVGEVREIG